MALSTRAVALSVATAAPTALAASRSRAMRQALLRPASAAAPPARPRKLVAAAAAVSVDAFTPPVLVLGAAALGLAQPALFSSLGPAAIAPALAVGSLATGLTIKAEDVKRMLSSPAGSLPPLAVRFAALPLVALAMTKAAGLEPAVAVGLSLVSACPGGTAGALGAVVATPLIASALLNAVAPIDHVAVLTLVAKYVLLPALAGVALNTAFSKQVAALRPALLSAASTALICGALLAQHSAAVLEAAPRLVAAAVGLHTAAAALGYAVSSKALGQGEAAARACGIKAGKANAALAAALAATLFQAQPMAAALCAVSACVVAAEGPLAAAVARAAGGGGSGRQSSASTWQVAPDTWIDLYRQRNGLTSPAPSGPPASGGRVSARAWIDAWRAKQGRP